MTTEHDTDEELTSYDEAVSDDTDDESSFRAQQLPSERYDGCNTPAEVNARFRELYDEARAAFGPDSWTNSDWTPHRNALGEDMRRAHARVARTAAKGTGRPRAPRAEIPDVHPVTNNELIMCVGKCGETKPAKKFPTLNGRPGRAGECRECRDKRLAEARLAN